MQYLKKILFLCSDQQLRTGGLLIIMMIIVALLDMIGVVSILPFVSILTNPSLIDTNLILNTMFKTSNIFGIETDQQFFIALGILVFVFLMIALIFKSISTYLQLRFTHMFAYSLSKRLFEGYLNQPYSWFLSRHSADLGKTILSEVNQVISLGVKPLIELISNSMVVIALVTLLLVVDPKLALIVGLVLGGFYIVVFYFAKSYLKKIGDDRLKNNQIRFTSISEAFGASKQIKLMGLEENYVKSFSIPARFFAISTATHEIISQIPRFILEIIAFGGILLILLYKISVSASFNNALPIVSMYVFAGYRLLPAVQNIYRSFTGLTFAGPSLDKIYDDFKKNKSFKKKQDHEVIKLNKTITLKNIYYNYPNSPRTILNDISLTIPAKSCVGFIGATGSGKTTIIDIILGLLEPQKGTLEIDGKIITNQNLKTWQRSIGYVPQHIYLSDNTIASNIAFGVEISDINQDLVKKASKIANLHQFVMDELPKQYKTIVGERGVRLSGGQRQRIGIARALYHNPQVLILDEATSALDNQTEKAVMDAVNNIDKDITIILIAHRISTLKKCDIIFKIDKGQLIDQGNFDKIKDSN